MHPALRKGPFFYKKNTPDYPLFLTKTPPFSTFIYNPPISFPAYGPLNKPLKSIGTK